MKWKDTQHSSLNAQHLNFFAGFLALRQGRSNDLLRALRYERALAYEDLGQKSRARAEIEKLYAEAPDFEDVAERLGL